MVTKVQSWGNSQGLRLSKQVLEEAHLSVGDNVDVAVCDGVIMIRPTKRSREKVSLRELVAQIPNDYKPEEIDWGASVGREVC